MSKVTPIAESPAIKKAFVTLATDAPVSAAAPEPALTLSPTSDYRVRSDLMDGYLFGSDVDFAEGRLHEVTEIGALERDWMRDTGYCPSIRSELRAKAVTESPRLTQQISWITPVTHQQPPSLTWGEVMSGYSFDGLPGCVPDDINLRNALSSVTIQSRHGASIDDHDEAKNDDAENFECDFVGNGGGAVLVTPSGEEVSYSTALLARGDAISDATASSEDSDFVAFTFPNTDGLSVSRVESDAATVGQSSGSGAAVMLEEGGRDIVTSITGTHTTTHIFRVQGDQDILDSSGEFEDSVAPLVVGSVIEVSIDL